MLHVKHGAIYAGIIYESWDLRIQDSFMSSWERIIGKNLYDTSNESLHKNKGNRATSLNGLELPAFAQGQALPGDQATSLNGPELPAFGQGEAIPGNQATSLNGLELGCMFFKVFRCHTKQWSGKTFVLLYFLRKPQPEGCCWFSGRLGPDTDSESVIPCMFRAGGTIRPPC